MIFTKLNKTYSQNALKLFSRSLIFPMILSSVVATSSVKFESSLTIIDLIFTSDFFIFSIIKGEKLKVIKKDKNNKYFFFNTLYRLFHL